MNETNIENMSFEEALQELEQIVAKLETGEVALEESIEIYRRGSKLRTHCAAKLKSAQARIQQLTADGKMDANGGLEPNDED